MNQEQARSVAHATLAQDNVHDFRLASRRTKPRVFDQERDDPDTSDRRFTWATGLEWSLIVTTLEHDESAVIRELGQTMRARLTEQSRAGHPSNPKGAS